MMGDTNMDTGLASEKRCGDVAAILAKGVLRFQHRIRRLDSRHCENCSESSPKGLEVLGEMRLSVSGVNATENS